MQIQSLNKTTFGIIALITSMFFGGKIVIIGIGLFVLSLFFSFSIKKLKTNYSLFVLFLFFIAHLISLFYTKNIDSGWFDIEVKLSIIVFPILFFLSKQDKFNKYQVLKYSYFITLIYIVFLILRGMYNSYLFDNINYLFYFRFSHFIHSSYLAMYLAIFLLIGIHFLFTASSKERIYYFIGNIILVSGIFFTESKIGYLSLFVILIIGLVRTFKNIKFKPKHYLISLAIITILVFSISQNRRFNSMVNVLKTFNVNTLNANTPEESTGVRILVWNSSLKVISENLIFGVGAGSIKQKLLKKYYELNYQTPLKLKLNAHNQFLETFIGLGIIGVTILLLIFIIPFIKAIKNKDFILQGFLIIVFINFLVESMLNTQAGVVFFAFFYSFLVFFTNQKETYNK